MTSQATIVPLPDGVYSVRLYTDISIDITQPVKIILPKMGKFLEFYIFHIVLKNGKLNDFDKQVLLNKNC